MEAGWVCACGRINRAYSCPRCGKSKPADAEPVVVEGPKGMTQKHPRSWFELSEDELKKLTTQVVDNTPSDRVPVAPPPPTPSSAVPRPRPTPAPVAPAPPPASPFVPEPVVAPKKKTTGVLKKPETPPPPPAASTRTRDWIGVVAGLLLAFFATRAEMRHWTARQIIDDEIVRGGGDIRETIPRMLEQKLGVKVKPGELQFIGVTEAGMRDGGIDLTVTIRSPSAGFYEQQDRIVKISPNRPKIFGFDLQPGREGVWVIEGWRQALRFGLIGFGLVLLTVCGVRRGTATE